MQIEQSISKKVSEDFQPEFYEIVNESRLHGGSTHPESHFKITIVSQRFLTLKKLDRHRLVQETLKEEIQKIKAFSLHVFTPSEWASQVGISLEGSSCRSPKV